MEKETMVQIIKYKCCGKIFAACCEPECYTDKDWLKSMSKYVKDGHKVELIPSSQFVTVSKCQCNKVQTLF